MQIIERRWSETAGVIKKNSGLALRIRVIVVGKTNRGFIEQGVEEYLKRLQRYLKTELQVIPDLKANKNLAAEQLMKREEEQLLAAIGSSDFFLLDEQGKEYTSMELASFMQMRMVSGAKELVLVIGGAYGVTPLVKSRAVGLIALSKLTFSHQMVRVFLLEQLYRCMTIIKGEPYHHE